MNRSVDLFVFDLAGTTVVDDDHVQRSFLASAQAFDLVVDPADLQSRMGWHKAKVFASLLEDQGRDASLAQLMADRFEVEFSALIAREPLRPTRGATDALLELQLGGVQIAFNTGFTRKTADLVLSAMGWSDHISVASDEVAAGRPAPDLIYRAMTDCGLTDPGRVGVAGDTPADLLAAEAASAGVIIGLGCGTHTLQQLRTHPHTLLLEDLVTLPEVVFGG
jgi:phosphonatase-like hydrolase